VYLVDKEHRRTLLDITRILRLFDRGANLLHAAEHGGDAEELRLGAVGQQPCQCGLAGAGGPQKIME